MALLDKFPRIQKTYHFLWAWLGGKAYGRPDKKIFVVGVTGTKGKTTTLELLNAMLEAGGKRTALLSSLREKIGSESIKNPTGNSMPGRAAIQAFLAKARDQKCDCALIEVTSQGVVQHRHRFIAWDVGALTNLSPEHIESHGSFENYRAAKLDFLKYVLVGGGQVFLNRDDAHYPFFAKALENISSAEKTSAHSKDEKELHRYIEKMDAPHFARRDSAPRFMLSDFNQENIAMAIAIARHMGVNDTAIDRALETFNGVPGRMEFITKGPLTAIVDYAHTPDSLEAAYNAAKPKVNANYPDARMICVLGAAGGGRDRWKRAEFGRIAAEYCDEIILTNEDPYDEDPEAILWDIRAGISEEALQYTNVQEVMDRREAIKTAVGMMRDGDVVIGTGKGSEDWIHIKGGKKIPWNERSEFESALEGR